MTQNAEKVRHVYHYYGPDNGLESWLNSLTGQLVAVFPSRLHSAVIGVTEVSPDDSSGIQNDRSEVTDE